jgi:L-lysine 6-oxidase
VSYQIHPKIGVARLGNSRRDFYLGPESTGGLPTECDEHGTRVIKNDCPVAVRRFKDAAGAIKRQTARFSVYRHDDPDTAGMLWGANSPIIA